MLLKAASLFFVGTQTEYELVTRTSQNAKLF